MSNPTIFWNHTGVFVNNTNGVVFEVHHYDIIGIYQDVIAIVSDYAFPLLLETAIFGAPFSSTHSFEAS